MIGLEWRKKIEDMKLKTINFIAFQALYFACFKPSTGKEVQNI